MKQNELLEKSKGLYYYVNKNKKSGKKPRKKGAKGYLDTVCLGPASPAQASPFAAG